MTTIAIIKTLSCLCHFYASHFLPLLPPFSSKIATGKLQSSLPLVTGAMVEMGERGERGEKVLSMGATLVKFALGKEGMSFPSMAIGIQQKRIDLIQQLLQRRSCILCNLQDADLSGANLINVKLIGASLIGANLSQVNLSLANLSQANLTGANLSKANLSLVNLTDADLTRANLSNVELRGAILDRVNLTGANLTGVNLTGVNLTGARLCGTLMPDGNISREGCIGVDN